MRAFYHLLGETLARRPGDLADRLTPWILTGLGGIILLLMADAWWSAPGY